MTDYRKWSLQSLFNKVARHLLKQGKRATVGKVPVFCDESGNRCAYGCLRPVKFYRDNNMEGIIVQTGSHQFYVILPEPTVEQNRLMFDLTLCHDFTRPSRWAQRLRAIARKFDLNGEVARA